MFPSRRATPRSLVGLLLTLLLSLALFAPTASAQDSYVPSEPPVLVATADGGTSLQFSGLAPGDTVTASFDLGAGVLTVTAVVAADGTLTLPLPAGASGVTLASGTSGASASFALAAANPQISVPATTPASPDAEPLAITGRGINIPIVVGALLISLGGLALLAGEKRRKTNARHERRAQRAEAMKAKRRALAETASE